MATRRSHDRDGPAALRLEAERGRRLVEESREVVLVLGTDGRVVAASRRARETIESIEEGQPVPADALAASGRVSFAVDYEVDGEPETLLYLIGAGELAAYEELRAGFTAAVSHELRTPLARLLVLLETALLPDARVDELVEHARSEVEQIGELIDDVLFLGELETGKQLVALGSTLARPVLAEALAELDESAARAGVRLDLDCPDDLELPLRPRMLRVVAKNLAENAIRYAGPGTRFVLAASSKQGSTTLEARDDGVGVAEAELLRLFERFYRADRARTSRGTGLGLAIVKHVVTAAGGTIEASGARGRGLAIRCAFPAG